MRANLVAALTSVVLIRGMRIGLVRRTRFGKSCEQAVAALFCDLPESVDKRLFSVDAGIATIERFAVATEHDALRSAGCAKTSLCAVCPDREDRANAAGHRCMGQCCILAPGGRKGVPTKTSRFPVEERQVRMRRWKSLHFARAPKTGIDVVRVDDPAYPRPLLRGSTATELTTEESRQAYSHRWPVETNFFFL